MYENQDCLAYAGHLQAEHRVLHKRLRDLQAELNSVTKTKLDAAMLERMTQVGQQLVDELAGHFREEEEGGCMDYAVSRVPGLAVEVRDLEAEHPQLLASMRYMLAQLRLAQPGELSVADFKQQFDAFVVRMLAHEARESRVVERGFNLPFDE
jgi:hemerythrin-like domain-containing protein